MAKNYKDVSYFQSRPDVVKIFDDLDEWLDYCRFNLIDFNPKHLYKSKEYKEWQKEKSKAERFSRKDQRSSNHTVN